MRPHFWRGDAWRRERQNPRAARVAATQACAVRPLNLCLYGVFPALVILLCSEADMLFRVPPRSVPGECPQGVEDLWRRCTLQDPGASPSEMLLVLVTLAELRRPPQPPAAQVLSVNSGEQA